MGLCTKSLCGLAVAAAVAAGPAAYGQEMYPEAVPGDVTTGMATELAAMGSGLVAVGTPGQSGYDTNYAEALTAALLVDWQNPVINYDYQAALVHMHLYLPIVTPAQNLAGVKAALRDGLVAYYLGNQVEAADGLDEVAVSMLMMDLAGALVATASGQDAEVELIVGDIVAEYGDTHPLGNTAIFEDYLATPNDIGVLVAWQNALIAELEGTAATAQGTTPEHYVECVVFCYNGACSWNNNKWDRLKCLLRCAVNCLPLVDYP